MKKKESIDVLQSDSYACLGVGGLKWKEWFERNLVIPAT